MTAFAISKFDPDNDPDRPILGTIIEHNCEKLRIEKVHWCTSKELMADNAEIMDKQGYYQCLELQHATRPAVHWLAWVNKVEAEQ